MMRILGKLFFAFLLLANVTPLLAGNNIMIIHDVTADPGEVIIVEIEVLNDDPFISFTLDIPIPIGFSYVPGSVALTERANGHNISATVLANNRLRIMENSITNTEFLGNEGVVATFEFQTSDQDGIYPLQILNGYVTGNQLPYPNILTGTVDGTVFLGDPDLDEYTLTIEFVGEGSVLVNGQPYNEPMTVPAGTTLSLLANPAPGWQFNGWTGDITGNDLLTSILMNDDKSVTANFTESDISQYTLTLNLTGSGSVTVNGDPYTNPVTVNEGTILELVAIPGNDYEFANWEGDAEGQNPQIEVLMDGNKNITAIFEALPPGENIMKINNATGSVGGETELELEIVNENEFVAFQAQIHVPEGFNYVEGSAYLEPDRKTDHLFTATEVEDGLLQFVVFSETNSPFLGNEGPVAYFSLINDVEPDDYDIVLEDGLISNFSGNNILSAKQDGILTILDAYTLLYLAGPNGTINGEMQVEQQVMHGEDGEELEAIPDTGFHFAEWSDGIADNPRADKNNTDDLTVTANFAINTYTITATANDDDFGTVTGEGIYDHFATATLTASANTGYHFVNWTENGDEVMDGDEPAGESYTFMVEGPRELVANFALTTYSITFHVVDESDQPVTDAVITLNGTVYEAGHYVFEDLVPDTYIYMVSRDEYFDFEGDIELIDEDLVVNVVLEVDDTSLPAVDLLKLEVYPIPARHMVNIEAARQLGEVRLFSIDGQLVYSAKVYDTHHQLDVSKLRRGIYLLQVTADHGIIKTLKIQIH